MDALQSMDVVNAMLFINKAIKESLKNVEGFTLTAEHREWVNQRLRAYVEDLKAQHLISNVKFTVNTSKVVHDLRGPKHKRKSYVLVNGKDRHLVIKGKSWRRVKMLARRAQGFTWCGLEYTPAAPVEFIQVKSIVVDAYASR